MASRTISRAFTASLDSTLRVAVQPSFLLLLCVSTGILYLGASLAQNGRLGFPLDDAWIHLTFARNLAQRQVFSFIGDQPSAGSTSPLWAFVLTPGFVWPLGPELWTYLVGLSTLFATALLTARVATRLFADTPMVSSLSGVVVALEWHMGWAALSGMETVFFIALLMLALDTYLSAKPLFWVAFVGGLLMVTRPEGIGLVGIIGVHWLLTRAKHTLRLSRQGRHAIRSLAIVGAAFLIPVSPYVWHNWTTSGLLFPNTFYAKQAEFAGVVAGVSLPVLFLSLATVPLVGALVLLVPGFLAGAWLLFRERRWDAGILLAWWIFLPLAYAVRLPATYQHGRYDMPVIPMVVMLGLWGTVRLGAAVRHSGARRIASRSLILAFALLLMIFWARGAQAFATDVEIMDCMVVRTARWLSANTQPDEIIAVHDVGAAGYYVTDRPLLDLAGLITPEVIPFIRDQSRLMDFILERGATYVVTSAAWHPRMIQDPRLAEVHHRECPIVRSEGGSEMGIYRIRDR